MSFHVDRPRVPEARYAPDQYDCVWRAFFIGPSQLWQRTSRCVCGLCPTRLTSRTNIGTVRDERRPQAIAGALLSFVEVRSALTGGRIARVIFTVDHGCMVLLHGFIKKTQATPRTDLDLARKRSRQGA